MTTLLLGLARVACSLGHWLHTGHHTMRTLELVVTPAAGMRGWLYDDGAMSAQHFQGSRAEA